MTAPAEAASLARLRAFLAAALTGLPPEFVASAVLAVDEACSNVVRHRRPELGCRDIELEVEIAAGRLQCRVGSFCGAEDLPQLRSGAVPPRDAGGRGAHFIACLMDRVDLVPDERRPGTLLLVLEKALPEGFRR